MRSISIKDYYYYYYLINISKNMIGKISMVVDNVGLTVNARTDQTRI